MTAKGWSGGAVLAAALLAPGWACMQDNSVGPDTIAGQGGRMASGSGGASAAGGSGGSGAGGAVDAGAIGAGGSTAGAGGGGGAGGPAGAGGGVGGGSGGGGPIVIMAGGASKCAATAASVGKLCDGFEGAAIGAAGSVWKSEAMGTSTAVVDTTKPYRGSKSAHLTTGGAQSFITETMTFNQSGSVAMNNQMWGRVFIWFQLKPMQTAPASHVVFIRLEDPANLAVTSSQLHLAGGSRGVLSAELRYNNGDHYMPAMGTTAAGVVKYPLPTPAWQCWEWHTTPSNTIEFFVDGNPYPLMTVKATDSWPFPIFKKLYLGFLQFGTNATTPADVWIDEVALDDAARIGCDN